MTIQEAARLGIKGDAIRKRIQRGFLDHEKGEDGRVDVYLDTTQDAPIEALRDRVSYLRDQLDQEREIRTEESRRHDTIVAQLMQRIPELESGASPEARESPQEAAAEPERESLPGSPDASPQTGSQRPWWGKPRR